MYLISTASSNAPEIKDWLVKRGLAGDTVRQLVAGLCQRLLTAGLPLLRAFVGLQTRHSLYNGYAYVWRDGVAQFAIDAYLRQGGENKFLWAVRSITCVKIDYCIFSRKLRRRLKQITRSIGRSGRKVVPTITSACSCLEARKARRGKMVP